MRLTELASSTASFERLAAANALGSHTSEPTAISLLKELSQDKDSAVREASLALLGEFAPRAPSALDHPSSETADELISLRLSGTSKVQRSEVPLKLLDPNSSGLNVEFPVPQANSLDVICTLIAESQTQNRSIRDCLALSKLSHRQWDYYENAIAFLDLEGFVFEEPEEILERRQMSLGDFVLFASALVGRHEVVRRILQEKLLRGRNITNDALQELVAIWVTQLGLPALSENTLARRRQTVQAWASWVISHLRRIDDFADGTQSAAPEPVNLTPMVVALLGCLDAEKPISSKPVSRRSYQSGKPHVLYKSEDFRKVLERLGRFRHSSGPTLDEIGVRYGVTRERIRQIEVKFSTLISNVVRTDGVEAFAAISQTSQPMMPIDLGDWVLRSLRLSLIETDVAPVSGVQAPTLDPSTPQLMNDGGAFVRSLSAEYGPEPVQLLPGWEHGAVEIAFALLRGALASAGYESGRDTNDFWILSGKADDPRLLGMIWPISNKELKRAKRLEQIKEVLAVTPMRASELSVKIGEESGNALREFMSRQPELTSRQGIWSIADPGENRESFRSIYDALIFVLEQNGPATSNELMERLSEIHSVSISRLLQAIDDRRVGRFDDGRIGLISEGAKRREEKEPEIPSRLVVAEPKAELLLTVNSEHLRGSGFVVPRWLGWRLGLVATPDSAELTASSGQKLTITRRGGQCYSGSIRRVLDLMSVKLNCSVGIEIDFEQRQFEAKHLCLEH